VSPKDELERAANQLASMSERIWDELKDTSLKPNLDLRELLFSDPSEAVFRADYLDAKESVREVDLRLFLEEDGRHPGERVNRFLEVTYFEHPHILPYFEAGTLQRDQHTLTYAVTERADGLVARPLNTEELFGFAEHVMAGLEYLHARDLVYCILSPHTVARVGAYWKLSDFSELRVAETDTADEVLSLRERCDTCPPEAAQGAISPAWDVWSFGQTLRKVLTGNKANMPDAFRKLFVACLHINPLFRPTLSQISGLLETARASDRKSDVSSAAKA
jgi:serine/threonine protein kinase